jgi:hypothetical protein
MARQQHGAPLCICGGVSAMGRGRERCMGPARIQYASMAPRFSPYVNAGTRRRRMPPRKKSKSEDAIISTTNGVTNGFHPMTDPTKSYEIIAHPVRTQCVAACASPDICGRPERFLEAVSPGVTITIGRHEAVCVVLPQLHSHQDLQRSPPSRPERERERERRARARAREREPKRERE